MGRDSYWQHNSNGKHISRQAGSLRLRQGQYSAPPPKSGHFGEFRRTAAAKPSTEVAHSKRFTATNETFLGSQNSPLPPPLAKVVIRPNRKSGNELRADLQMWW